jgi:hypothetical protein
MIRVKSFWVEPNYSIKEQTFESLSVNDFRYYDKDGFELCAAEHKFYIANAVHLNPCLNHSCCQQDWLDLDSDKVFVDHALILHRFDYVGGARAQLLDLAETIPQAGWLLQTEKKWGFDLAIDSRAEGASMFEVVHIEYDDVHVDSFNEKLLLTQEHIERIDWEKAAAQIWSHRESWMYLKGFHQNHWKAKYLLGWNKAEYTEKTI